MNQSPYPYNRTLAHHYTFTSHGKTLIQKVVIFAPSPFAATFNLGFGDLLADGSFDDEVNSNNGDVVKVLSTVIQILKQFTSEHPGAKVIFGGSTASRTKMYRRILKTYYPAFSKDFVISALVASHAGYKEIDFDPATDEEYLPFL